MERETKTIKTPSGHIAEIKTYLTGGERMAINKIYFAKMKLTINTEEPTAPQLSDVPGDITLEAQTEAIKQLVISVNNKKENVLDLVMNLPEQDTQAIIDEVMKIVGGEPAKKK